VHKRRVAKLILVVALAAGLGGGLGACGGAKAGDGVTNPPSTKS